jgi:hypothetical protein
MPISELIVCASDEVSILQLRQGAAPEKIWHWRGPDKRFAYTAECKPVDGGSRILVACSTDGVALVERATGRTEFEATVTNAHSAELLPGNRIAVAASHRGRTGNRLVVFDLTGGERVSESELPSGHGLVWDAQRDRLWALSGSDLRCYSSSLKLLSVHPLPDAGGHDVSPVSGGAELAVTTNNSCWLFDREKLSFVPHPVLRELVAVKSVDMDPRTRQLVYVQADPGCWWSERLRFATPPAELFLKGQKIYKARWCAA